MCLPCPSQQGPPHPEDWAFSQSAASTATHQSGAGAGSQPGPPSYAAADRSDSLKRKEPFGAAQGARQIDPRSPRPTRSVTPCPSVLSPVLPHPEASLRYLVSAGPFMECPCGGGPCLVRMSNTQKNPNREFFKCPKPQVRRSSTTRPSPPSSATVPSPAPHQMQPRSPLMHPPSCRPIPVSTQDEQCRFFKWVDEAANQSPMQKQQRMHPSGSPAAAPVGGAWGGSWGSGGSPAKPPGAAAAGGDGARQIDLRSPRPTSSATPCVLSCPNRRHH